MSSTADASSKPSAAVSAAPAVSDKRDVPAASLETPAHAAQPDVEQETSSNTAEQTPAPTATASDDKKQETDAATATVGDTDAATTTAAGSKLSNPDSSTNGNGKPPSTAGKRSTKKEKVTKSPPPKLATLNKLDKKKKKKKRSLWSIVKTCFSPSKLDSHLDDDLASAGSSSPKEKKPATNTTAKGSSPAGPTTSSRPHTPANEEVDVIVPPTPTTHLLPKDETGGLTSGAVQPPGSTGTEHEDSDRSSFTDDDHGRHIEEENEEERLILNGGNGIPIGPDGQPAPLLPALAPAHKGKKCLVLDLDETLVHSSFKLIPQADYVVPVEIEWQWHNVYVIKRPGVDNFLKRMGEIYEIVVFTASLSKYADPVLDKLDVHKVVSHRLFRESCFLHKGNYVKDLSQLGRPIGDTIILDNSPASYIFHPNNAVPVSSWFNDPHDTELTDMSPFLADLAEVSDIRGILDGGV